MSAWSHSGAGAAGGGAAPDDGGCARDGAGAADGGATNEKQSPPKSPLLELLKVTPPQRFKVSGFGGPFLETTAQ